MQISKKQLIDLVRRAYEEGLEDAPVGVDQTDRLRNELWLHSDTINDLRYRLYGG